MKSFYLCIISIFLLFSCSETSEFEAANTSSLDLSSSHRFSDSIEQKLPFNPANSYDYVGQLHHELYLDYYKQKNDSLTLSEVITKVETLANQSATFLSYFENPYQFYDVAAVTNLLACDTLCIDTVIANSALSVVAQNKMKTFLTEFTIQFENNSESDPIMDYIFLYETQIINANDLLELDKAILLSTTSIARYSAYESKRRPKKNTDPDWDSLITNLLGNIVGAPYGIDNGLKSSLVCGILSNE